MGNVKLTGRIVVPGDHDYEEAREEFNTRYSLYPCVIVFCQNTEDVVNAVKWAKQKNIPFRVRTGRHSYEAYSSLDGGLVIDISEMNAVRVTEDKRLISVQAGALLLPLYTELYDQGVTIPGGTCPSVGLAGLTLGAGWGMLTRKYGMLCDRLLALEMVTADGKIIFATDEWNSDLFWACRGGGGGNFGIVTKFLFQAVRVDQVAIYKIVWPWSGFKKVVDAFQRFAPCTDKRLTGILDIYTKEIGELKSLGEFLGSKDELRKLLTPLLQAYPPKEVEIQEVPYIDAVRIFGGLMPGMKEYDIGHGDPDAHPFKNTGAFAKTFLPSKGIKILKYFLEHSPSIENKVQLQALGGSARKKKPNQTAYVHRDALFSLLYITKWQESREAKKNVKWVEKMRDTLLPFADGAYVNFHDNCICNWLEQAYGSNLHRLQEVKTKYDPHDEFTFPLGIPPY
ncbi:FAD-binding oxidoreductase [Fictibacillus iocasae]|uniref:FAD-binding oxidoreductase n=1 Tax=Fictibacillus iocasae TaxID=2715437 RepID=A0ABW2NV48_9BACL